MSGPIEQWVLVLLAGSSIMAIGIMVWALLEIRRIMTQTQQTLTSVRGQLVLLIQEMRETTEQADGLVRDIREAFQSTSTLWYALGDLGQSVQRLQSFAREKAAWAARWLGAIIGGATNGIFAGRNGMHRETEFTKRRSADD